MITHRMGLSHWEEGFTAIANKEAVKVIFTYDYPDADTAEFGEKLDWTWKDGGIRDGNERNWKLAAVWWGVTICLTLRPGWVYWSAFWFPPYRCQRRQLCEDLQHRSDFVVALKEHVKTPMDAHLMVSHPQEHHRDCARQGCHVLHRIRIVSRAMLSWPSTES